MSIPKRCRNDWKLSGYELMIADEIFRGRFRNSFEKPEPITPNEVTPFTIDLHTADHVFKKGHRIMVQVQSTWFPLYDRNPQKFVPNIFEAKDSDYQKATQRIYRSKRFPSSVEISVLPSSVSTSPQALRQNNRACPSEGRGAASAHRTFGLDALLPKRKRVLVLQPIHTEAREFSA